MGSRAAWRSHTAGGRWDDGLDRYPPGASSRVDRRALDAAAVGEQRVPWPTITGKVNNSSRRRGRSPAATGTGRRYRAPATRLPPWPSDREWWPRCHRRGRSCSPSVGSRGVVEYHVLGHGAQRDPDRAVARIVPCSPGTGEDLVGPPAEHERVGAPEDLVHDRAGFAVEVSPPAALECSALGHTRLLVRQAPASLRQPRPAWWSSVSWARPSSRRDPLVRTIARRGSHRWSAFVSVDRPL